MIDPTKPAQILEEMGNKFSEMMQSGPARDFEKNARALFASGMARLDLVTREEFEVQKALLQSACEKIEALEKRLAAQDTARKEDPEP